jgi:predicted HAD superfamily Cof-like phosphohydrolase
MASTNSWYRAESLGEAGWSVFYTNPVTGAETVVWERVNEKRAKDLARGGNLMMDQILAAAARSFQDDVRAFHAKFGHPQPDELTLPKPEHLRFRASLIREEAKESGKELEGLADLLELHSNGTVPPHVALEISQKTVKCLQEMADSLYVGFGGFVIFGVSARAVFEKVQEANMSKIPNPNGGKPQKPEGWVSPLVRIEEMLR